MSHPESVLIDLDSVIVNTAPGIAHALTCALWSNGRVVFNEIGLQPLLDLDIKTLFDRAVRAAGLVLSESEHNKSLAVFLQEYRLNALLDCEIAPRIHEWMESLQDQGFRIGVVSRFEANTQSRVLTLLDLAHLVDETAAASESPFVSQLMSVMTKLNARPSRTVFISGSSRAIVAATSLQLKLIDVRHAALNCLTAINHATLIQANHRASVRFNP